MKILCEVNHLRAEARQASSAQVRWLTATSDHVEIITGGEFSG